MSSKKCNYFLFFPPMVIECEARESLRSSGTALHFTNASWEGKKEKVAASESPSKVEITVFCTLIMAMTSHYSCILFMIISSHFQILVMRPSPNTRGGNSTKEQAQEVEDIGSYLKSLLTAGSYHQSKILLPSFSRETQQCKLDSRWPLLLSLVPHVAIQTHRFLLSKVILLYFSSHASRFSLCFQKMKMADRQKESLPQVRKSIKDAARFQKKFYPLVKIKSLFCLSSPLDPEPNKEIFLFTLTEATLSSWRSYLALGCSSAPTEGLKRKQQFLVQSNKETSES